jgi:hypothetical protein
MSWLPFDSAPRDRTHFIVCTGNGTVGEAYWHDEDEQCWWANTDPSDYHGGPVDDPRWWQPLPAPHPDARRKTL